MAQKKTKTQTIRVAILAQEPLGWGSGKHYFPVILDNYTWKKGSISYKFKTTYIWDKDIIKGKLNTTNYDVLLVPGGGVGDGQAIAKGFNEMIPSDLAESLVTMADRYEASGKHADKSISTHLTKMENGIRAFINVPLNAM